MGRPTLITHPDATTTALAYDQTGTDYNAPNQPNASNGTLSRITDPSGTTTYQRDQFGRITRTTQQLKVLGEGATHTLATSYNAAGQIATITYPGAGKLTHLYNSTGQLTGLNWNDLPLLTGIIYNPLGQPTSWAWQYADTNAVTQTATTRRYNSAGQLTQSANAAYTWDSAGRITAINENLLVPASAAQGDTRTTTLTVPWRAQYDALGRITQWSSAGKTATIAATGTTPAINATYYPATINYSYDANGNPTATNATSTTGQGAWSQTKQYTTNATTNRLLGVATTTAQGSAAPTTATIASTYNGAGDPITDGVRNYTYDSQRRIDSISLLGANPAKTYYAHNILGQRIFKTEALFGVPTANAKKLGWAYVYDASGTLMGEYGMGGSASSGSTQHIYLPTAAGSLPVAAVINGQHYAVHADHLNTPRRLTGSNNQVVWQWAFSAFGQEPPTTPDKRFTNASTKPSTGTTTAAAVTYNLRYPGQVYDAESKLHYNYHRTYDPQTGRYTQPDPIGLDGGWNRYSYVGGNPLSYTDPMGLARILTPKFGSFSEEVQWRKKYKDLIDQNNSMRERIKKRCPQLLQKFDDWTISLDPNIDGGYGRRAGGMYARTTYSTQSSQFNWSFFNRQSGDPSAAFIFAHGFRHLMDENNNQSRPGDVARDPTKTPVETDADAWANKFWSEQCDCK